MYPKTQMLIQTQQAQGVFPGASFSFLNEKNQSASILGFSQLVPEKEVLRENMLYDMASVTKVVCTGSVVLKLWEKNLLDLAKPLAHYYPAFQDRHVTIRQLLTHTSDIHSFIPNRDQLTGEALKKAFLTLKSGKNRGRVCQYTDTGTVLLAFMLEELFQKDAQTIFQEQVLGALQMNESTFGGLIFPKTRAIPTELTEKRGLIRGQTHDPKAYRLGTHAGSAGLFATRSDLEKYVRQVFFEQTYHAPQTIQALQKDWTGTQHFNRSLGWDLKTDNLGRTWLFHSGFTGTFLLIQPEIKRAFVFLSNRVHPENHRESYIQHRDFLIQTYLEEQALAEVMV